MDLLTVLYINYHASKVLGESIRSVRAAMAACRSHLGPAADMRMVIANNSPEDDLSLLRAEDITIMQMERNLGFGRAVNRACEQIGSEYILLLNPDTSIDREYIYELLRFLQQQPGYAIAYGLLRNPDGSVQTASLRDYPDVLSAVIKLSGLWRWPRMRSLVAYNKQLTGYDQAQDVNVASGACMMVRAKAFHEIHGFDERFFLYAEDIDLSRRLREAGYGIRFLPHVAVMHIKQYSVRHDWFRPLFHFYASMVLYLAKYARGITGYLQLGLGFLFISLLFFLQLGKQALCRLLGK